MGQFPEDGENGQNVALILVLVLAYLEPELELFEVWEIKVRQIIIIANGIKKKQLLLRAFV